MRNADARARTRRARIQELKTWHTQLYTEEFSENPYEMQGFKDIISCATGGDTIQLFLKSKGKAYVRNIFCEMQVIL